MTYEKAIIGIGVVTVVAIIIVVVPFVYGFTTAAFKEFPLFPWRTKLSMVGKTYRPKFVSSTDLPIYNVVVTDVRKGSVQFRQVGKYMTVDKNICPLHIFMKYYIEVK